MSYEPPIRMFKNYSMGPRLAISGTWLVGWRKGNGMVRRGEAKETWFNECL